VTAPRCRRFARVVAVLLLGWMTADLVGHGMGVHDPEGIGTPAVAPVLTAVGPGLARAADAPHDCFCCFHVAEVRAPFRLPLASAIAWRIFSDSDERPHSDPLTLYHPPLA